MRKKHTKNQKIKPQKAKVTQKKVNVKSLFPWQQNWLPISILFALAIALYAYSVTFDYVLDDQIVLTKNAYVQKGLSGIGEILSTESMSGRFGGQKDLIVGARYRPLSIVTFAMEYELFGVNAFVSHLINILLYGLLGVLLYRVLCMLFPQKRDWYWSIPFIATLLFVVHPIHTEVVANVKGRDEIMTLLGALGAMYYAIRYTDTHKIIHLLLAGIVFFLALLAKENALTFLAVIPFTLYIFKNTSFKNMLATLIPLVVVSVAYLVIRYQVIGYFLSPEGKEITDIMNNPFYGLTTGEKMATIFYTLGLYLKLLFFPHPLTHDYYPYQIPILNWGDMRAILPLIAHIGLGILAVWGMRKKSVLSYGILFYVATLSIVSNIPFTVGTFMNERFLFIPSIGFCLIIAWLLINKIPEWLNNQKGAKLISKVIVGIFLLGFIGKTIDRVPDWKNRLALNLSGATASPNSARANCFLGTAIFEEEYQKEKDRAKKQALLEEVDYFINRSLSIHPTYGAALTMKAGVAAEEYSFDRNLDKLLAEFYSVLQRKYKDTFIEEYTAYLINRVDKQKLADFCYKVGFDNYTQVRRDYKKAVQYLNYGLQVAPNDAKILNGIAQTYELMGDTQTANSFRTKVED